MNNTEEFNEISDDELTNIFKEDSGNDTKTTDKEDTVQEDSDEDLENLFQEQQQPTTKSSNDGEPSAINPADKSKQKREYNTRSQDLLDANGKLLARAGAERRFYEENQRMKREMQNFNNNVLPQIRQQYATMQNELEQYKGVIEGIRATDLTPQDIQSGLDFVRNWRKNPTEVVKFLLTSLQASGIDVDISGNNGTQMSAIKQMIDEKFEPFLKEREEAEKYARQEQEVDNMYNEFISKYPDSVVHDKVLAHMVQHDPTLTPEVAYLQLKNYYLRNNLDFTKSLEEIAKENMQKKPNQGLPKTPMISDTVATKPQQQKVADVGTSINDIIKQAMTEAGY